MAIMIKFRIDRVLTVQVKHYAYIYKSNLMERDVSDNYLIGVHHVFIFSLLNY